MVYSRHLLESSMLPSDLLKSKRLSCRQCSTSRSISAAHAAQLTNSWANHAERLSLPWLQSQSLPESQKADRDDEVQDADDSLVSKGKQDYSRQLSGTHASSGAGRTHPSLWSSLA